MKDYWITDGLYGSMNGIIYDHCMIQAGYLKNPEVYDYDTADLPNVKK